MTASMAAGASGQITANPETVIIPAGVSSGSTLISWTTVNCTAAQVTVTAAGGAEQLFGDATSFQNAHALWIGLPAFTFRLYGDRTRTLLLDSFVVTGIRPPTGSITASPSTFTIAGGTTFSTDLSWTTSQAATGWVTRSAAGAPEELVTQGGSTSGFEVSGLGAGRTLFRLYADEARTRLLDLVEVTGTTSPLTVQADGTLCLDNRPFTSVGVNYFDAFGRVLWNAADTSYEAGFQALGQWGLPFARLDLSGYQPIDAAHEPSGRAMSDLGAADSRRAARGSP